MHDINVKIFKGISCIVTGIKDHLDKENRFSGNYIITNIINIL